MIEIHEMLERELDPVDDVRRKFENSYTEDYWNPLNGDWISDDYWNIIDLTTKPGELSEVEASRLNRMIMRLNSKYSHIQRRLGDSSLLGAYVDVAEQVTDINRARETEGEIIPMYGASMETLPAINYWVTKANASQSEG